MSEQIACAVAESKYKLCPNFKNNEQKNTEQKHQNSYRVYSDKFNNVYEHYLSLRNSNKILQASIEPIRMLTQRVQNDMESSDKELSSLENQINSFENELRESNITTPVVGPFGSKNTDTGIQLGFYIVFFIFLIILYLYVTLIVMQGVFSIINFVMVCAGAGLIVYIANLFVNKFITTPLFVPEKLNSPLLKFKSNVQIQNDPSKQT